MSIRSLLVGVTAVAVTVVGYLALPGSGATFQQQKTGTITISVDIPTTAPSAHPSSVPSVTPTTKGK